MSDIVSRAEVFARAAHAGQNRKGAAQEPYVVHLEEVADFVRRHGGDEIAVAAAWLHDTVEDCDGIEPLHLVVEFGAEVAAVVGELTDDKSLPKEDRKRLQVLHAPSKSPRAALVKLGDKTSNVISIGRSRPVDWDTRRCLIYVAWAEEVAAALPGAVAEARAELAQAAQATRRLLAGESQGDDSAA